MQMLHLPLKLCHSAMIQMFHSVEYTPPNHYQFYYKGLSTYYVSNKINSCKKNVQIFKIVQIVQTNCPFLLPSGGCHNMWTAPRTCNCMHIKYYHLLFLGHWVYPSDHQEKPRNTEPTHTKYNSAFSCFCCWFKYRATAVKLS